jgi:hypothetical protein
MLKIIIIKSLKKVLEILIENKDIKINKIKIRIK